MRVVVTAPASVANMGPGFDCLAAAIDMHLVVTASTDTEALRVTVTGEGADRIPTDDTNLVVRAAAAACDPLPPVDLRIDNPIPLARGLGSSAAAAAAGLVLGRALAGAEADPAALLRRGLSFEGHPDNLAAALYGGLTLVLDGDDVLRLDPLESVRPLVVVPEQELATSEARAVLPAEVPRADAVANAAWTAGLVAMLTGAADPTPEALLACTQDRIHQSQRASLMPDTAEAVTRLRESGVAACVSGAGPSVLCLVVGSGEDVVRQAAPAGWRLVPSAWEPRGAWAEKE